MDAILTRQYSRVGTRRLQVMVRISFVCYSDDQVREIDPANDLYPFMVAASGETSDLSAVYVLLRRNPSLVRGGNLENGGRHSNRRRKRKEMRWSNNHIKHNKRN